MSDPQLKPCNAKILAVRENFKQDYKLSCPVIDDDDIFAKSLRIADLTTEWDNYLDMSQRYPDINEYRKEIRNKITQHISVVKGFAQEPVQKYQYPYEATRSYLEEHNIGKIMLSIDLVKGNYQSMKHLNPAYTLHTETYEELIGKFSTEACLISSKMFRQMVFGLLRPDLQASVQKNLLGKLISIVFKVKNYPIVSITNDEVMIEIPSVSDLKSIETTLKQSETPILYRLTLFRIEKIPNTYGDNWYVKHFINPDSTSNKKRLMGVHIRYLMQVSNHVEGVPNTEKDFWWRERGRLCKLLEAEQFN